MPRDVVRIDGTAPIGWKFVRFDIERGEHKYVGVVAQYIGEAVVGYERRDECVIEHRSAGDWLKVHDAAEFMQRAVQELRYVSGDICLLLCFQGDILQIVSEEESQFVAMSSGKVHSHCRSANHSLMKDTGTRRRE